MMLRLLLSAILVASPLALEAIAQGSDSWQAAGLTRTDESNIRQAYLASRHEIREASLGHEAFNPTQRWTTVFDGHGFELSPTNGDWSWGLNLTSYGWGADQSLTGKPRTISPEGGRIVYEWDTHLTEWYVNDTRGLEHGYTVSSRPALEDGASRSLELILEVRGCLEPVVSTDGRDVRFVDVEGASVLNYSGLTVFDADGQVLDANFSRIPRGLHLRVDDHEARYPLTIDPIAQQAYIKASNTEAMDSFGSAVSISGDTVVVGARDEDSGASGVGGDQANNASPQSGAAYVFVRDGISWTQQAYLKASNPNPSNFFGLSVSISGDTIVVGAPFESSDATGVNGNQSNTSAPTSGAAYVFVRDGDIWSQEAYLKASNTGNNDNFGTSVAISNNTIAVGASFEFSGSSGVNGDQSDNGALGAGAVYVYERTGDVWSQGAYLKASNAQAVARFGFSVAISGDTIVVGSDSERSSATGVNGDQSSTTAAGAGAAYVFVRSGASWAQQAYLKASNTDAEDFFGRSVAISGDVITVGAPGEDSNARGVDGDGSNNGAQESGAAYVFARSKGTWTQQAYLKASNSDQDDQFGSSVLAQNNIVIVGAISEDSGAVGVDGDDGDNGAPDSGAAYVFSRGGATWSQQGYLKASNTDQGDMFGWSMGISGTTVVIGAIEEAGSSTGSGGIQGDNAAPKSGAAYMFEVPQPESDVTVVERAFLKASNAESLDRFGTSISISGDTAIVGAWEEDSDATGVDGDEGSNLAPDSGAAYIFVRDGLDWVQQAYLKPQNTEAGDRFAISVSISGDLAIIGADRESSSATGIDGDGDNNDSPSSGAAYIFSRKGTLWSQEAYLKASNTDPFDFFGCAVSISGNTAVVGAEGERGNGTGVDGDQGNNDIPFSGAMYVFIREEAGWTQQAYLKASNNQTKGSFDPQGDGLGGSVSISGDRLVGGAVGDDSDTAGVNGASGDINGAAGSGAVYVFVRDGATWSQDAYVKASNPGADDLFGGAVSISGATFVVGAQGEDGGSIGVNGAEGSNNLTDSGAAYIFALDADVWVQQAYLKSSNSDLFDRFGRSVATFGDTVVVGTIEEDSASVGVNSNEDNDTVLGMSTGAAYVFIRDGDSWRQEAYLKSSNSFFGALFGSSVAISGSTIAVGARSESSAAGGPPEFTSLALSGSAYIFEASPPPSLQASPVSLSLSAGGMQTFSLSAGTANAGDVYLLLGSLSGTDPGLALDSVLLPLNPDGYLTSTLTMSSSALYTNSLGLLDSAGQGTASFNVPAGTNPAFAGIVVNHAYVAISLVGPEVVFASNPVSVTLTP